MTSYKSNLQSGFTLIEVLLVMVVIAVMVSLLTANFTDNPAKQLEREATRLTMLLQAVADEAVLQGAEFSLATGSTVDDKQQQGYQFLQLDKDRQWQPVAGRSYEFYALPKQISLRLVLNGDQVFADFSRQIKPSKELGAHNNLHPAILLLSSGEQTPFIITLTHKGLDRSLQIVSDGVSGAEIL